MRRRRGRRHMTIPRRMFCSSLSSIISHHPSWSSSSIKELSLTLNHSVVAGLGGSIFLWGSLLSWPVDGFFLLINGCKLSNRCDEGRKSRHQEFWPPSKWAWFAWAKGLPVSPWRSWKMEWKVRKNGWNIDLGEMVEMGSGSISCKDVVICDINFAKKGWLYAINPNCAPRTAGNQSPIASPLPLTSCETCPDQTHN